MKKDEIHVCNTYGLNFISNIFQTFSDPKKEETNGIATKSSIYTFVKLTAAWLDPWFLLFRPGIQEERMPFLSLLVPLPFLGSEMLTGKIPNKFSELFFWPPFWAELEASPESRPVVDPLLVFIPAPIAEFLLDDTGWLPSIA